MSNKGFIGSIIFAIVIIVAIILGFACTERIPAGYVGVVYNMNGGIEGETLSQGFHLVSPHQEDYHIFYRY